MQWFFWSRPLLKRVKLYGCLVLICWAKKYRKNVWWNLWDTCFSHSSLLPGATCIKRKQQRFMNFCFSFHVAWGDKEQLPRVNCYCTDTVTVFNKHIFNHRRSANENSEKRHYTQRLLSKASHNVTQKYQMPVLKLFFTLFSPIGVNKKPELLQKCLAIHNIQPQ